MNIPETFASLAGEWVGINRLWLTPDSTAIQSVCSASISLAARGKFLSISYTWVYKDEPQEGLMIVGFDQNQQSTQAAWVDSWHMNDQIMICQSSFTEAGTLMLKGFYPAPPGPEWGWWIELDPQEGPSFKLVMYNVTPEGQALLAVEALFNHQAG
jgi:hypothetical protein